MGFKELLLVYVTYVRFLYLCRHIINIFRGALQSPILDLLSLLLKVVPSFVSSFVFVLFVCESCLKSDFENAFLISSSCLFWLESGLDEFHLNQEHSHYNHRKTSIGAQKTTHKNKRGKTSTAKLFELHLLLFSRLIPY